MTKIRKTQPLSKQGAPQIIMQEVPLLAKTQPFEEIRIASAVNRKESRLISDPNILWKDVNATEEADLVHEWLWRHLPGKTYKELKKFIIASRTGE
jgi:hypothetical protein